ncbi:MAG: hypothetical protein QXN55_05625 [Candidatus Nitrosotenuis sp.]
MLLLLSSVMTLCVLFSIPFLAMGSIDQSERLTIQNVPQGLPTVSTIKDLEKLSKNVLQGMIIEIKPITLQAKSDQSGNQTISADQFTIKLDNKSKNSSANNTIRFLAFRYIVINSSKSDENIQRFQTGENISVFLTKKDLESDLTNDYAGFVANKHVISEGIAYDVPVMKQLSPLTQLKSGIHSRDVNCNDGLELLLKVNNGQPICVKPETKQKLIERGWAKP